MWRRGSKLESSSYLLSEVGKLLCFPCRSYSNSVVHLHNSITKADLFLVGVHHGSPKSAEFVRHVIKNVMPNVVAVELCKERGRAIQSYEPKSMTWDEFSTIKGGLKVKILHFIINELYAYIAAKGLKPGDEFRVAIEEGFGVGANILCIDQDINVTFKRFAQELSLMELIRFFVRRKEILRQYPVLFEALNSGNLMMYPKAMEEAMGFADKYFPGLAKSMVHERNEYMVKRLRKMSGSIVGVVGALHVQGMHKLWHETEVEPL